MEKLLFLDTETFSEVDIFSAGAAKYARDPSTECLIITWGFETGTVHAEDLTLAPMSWSLRKLLLDPRYTKVAHNAPFDKDILKFTQGIDIPWEEWKDSQALAYSLGFTGSMGAIQEALGFSDDVAKIKEGKKLIQRFSKLQPKRNKVRRWTRENSPEEWQRFIDYGVRDTESMREMWMLIAIYGSMSDYEWEAWRETQRMNDRGMPISRELVAKAIKLASLRKNEIKSEMIEMTGLDNPNSVTQLLEWVRSQGVEMPNMQAGTIKDMLEFPLPELVRDVLEKKRVAAQTAVTKWNSIDKMLCDDDVIRGQFLYRGASRTGRDASRGVNLQNLRRPPDGNMEDMVSLIEHGSNNIIKMIEGEPLDFLAGTVRGAIQADDGKTLVVSDLSSIESRVLGWLCGCIRMNGIFEQGLDTYKDFAMELFSCSYDEVTKKQRTFSKPPVLGAGYMMGGKGLSAYANGMGVPMSVEEAQKAVYLFRTVYPEIPKFWDWINTAVERVIRTGETSIGYRMRIYRTGGFLAIQLPSGRSIYYYQPLWQTVTVGSGEDSFETMAFTYMGINRFRPSPTWERVNAHAGGITENIVQAIARDILIEWVRRCSSLHIIGRVHDEVIIQVAEDPAEKVLQYVNGEISRGIDWAPGLLLAAEGFITKNYTKD